jgi:hypothetical protein
MSALWAHLVARYTELWMPEAGIFAVSVATVADYA